MSPVYKSRFFVVLAMSIMTTLPEISGFSFQNLFQQPLLMKPDLLQITEKQTNQLLKIQLNIGEEDGPQMSVSDIVVELHPEPADYDHASLPGADGQNHKLSTQHRRLDVISEGYYINMSGMQTVQMDKACWEMCWRKDKPAGTLIVGCELPQDYWRNEAVLPQGDIFISFPVWTTEGLKIGQEEKRKVEVQLQQFLDERDEALLKFEGTENPIMRAIYLQNAFAALNRYNNVDHQTMQTIPEDHQILYIQEDLLLSYKGLVWGKDEPSGGYILLGDANLSLGSQKSKSQLLP